MLTSLRLVNFKSFAEASVELAPLTVLVGANAAGKSNFFDAIRFLQGNGLDMGVGEILRGRWEGGREIWPGIRGGPKEVALAGERSFTICSTWGLKGRRVEHELGCITAGLPQIEKERLAAVGEGDYLFDTHAPALGANVGLQPGDALRAALKREKGGRNKTNSYSSSRSILGQLERDKAVADVVFEVAADLQNALREILFLDVSPSRMRGYVPRQARSIGAEAENLSAVLAAMCESEDKRLDVVDWLTELIAPEVADISFIETELGDVMLQLVEPGERRISARSLSDGTLRFLGQLVALKAAPPGSLVLIEEIENGLHPRRIHLMVELLESVTRSQDLQVIVTTHSPQVLAALSPEDLGNAIVFAKDPENGNSAMSRLSDLPNFREILERKGIEYLFTTGWLERAL